MKRYKAAFIIPINAKKVLTDDGWVFESNNTLPPNVTYFLMKNLNLKLDEEYLGIRSYSNERYQAVVSLNDDNEIEYIQIKVYGDYMELLLREYRKFNISEYAELFVP